MLDRPRSTTPAAIRARHRRERERDGIGCFDFKYEKKRLRAALRAATRIGDDASHAEIKGAVVTIVEDFCTRWIGPKKIPHA